MLEDICEDIDEKWVEHNKKWLKVAKWFKKVTLALTFITIFGFLASSVITIWYDVGYVGVQVLWGVLFIFSVLFADDVSMKTMIMKNHFRILREMGK